MFNWRYIERVDGDGDMYQRNQHKAIVGPTYSKYVVDQSV